MKSEEQRRKSESAQKGGFLFSYFQWVNTIIRDKIRTKLGQINVFLCSFMRIFVRHKTEFHLINKSRYRLLWRFIGIFSWQRTRV